MATGARATDRLRLAVFHTDLGRQGPGLLLRDIQRAEGDVAARIETLVQARPDVVLLLGFDHDHEGRALAAFATALARAGHAMPHAFAPAPNSGAMTAHDLDGDGRRGGPGDAQGWGRFAGAGGMALLSRLPLDRAGARDHAQFLWRDLPGARLPLRDGAPFYPPEALDILRLHSVAAWEIPVDTGGTGLTLLAWHAGPPAFDGPERRNQLRNADQTAFWRHRLTGALGPAPPGAFVLMGNANLDPARGAGLRDEMRALLAMPQLQDPRPRGPHPRDGQIDDATAWWPDGPGALRVDYILPSAGLRVLDSGLIWPPPPAAHALVWLDLAWPPP